MENKIQDSYQNKECPDCGEHIPDTAANGDKCSNCGHALYEAHIPNNICVIETEPDLTDSHCLPTVVARYNYTSIELISRHESLKEAVDEGRKVAEKRNLPLTVSSKYLNRPETKGLSMCFTSYKKIRKMKFNTIEELYEKVKSGEIDESKLVIILDNDNTSFHLNGNTEPDPEGYHEFSKDIKVSEANGCLDVKPLYKLLFPKAVVEWC